MPTGSTPNYSWPLPTVAGDTAIWGTQLNNNLTSIDSVVHGLANPATVTVNSTPGTSVKGTLTFKNSSASPGQQDRWWLTMDTVTESGGNVGSNLSLQAYSDLGALISTPMGFTRSSGAVSFNGAVTVAGVATLGGTITNDSAAAGVIGEYKNSTVAIGSAVGLGSGTPGNIASIALTAGDWNVWGNVLFTSTGSPASVTFLSSVSTVSGGVGSNPAMGTLLPNGGGGMAVPVVRASLAGPATVFLVAEAVFTGGTISAYGSISARRVR